MSEVTDLHERVESFLASAIISEDALKLLRALLAENQKLRAERDTLTSNLHEVLGPQIPLVDAAWTMRKRAEAAEAELARLQEQNRWIPVGEKLPEDDGFYWTWTPGTDRPSDIYFCYRERLGRKDFQFEGVTHWRPLPARPAGEEKKSC